MRSLLCLYLVVIACASSASAATTNSSRSLLGALFHGLGIRRLCQGNACVGTADCQLGNVCLPNPSGCPARKCGRGNVTYVPGKAAVYENGLVLSQGLTSRLIAVTGQPVKFANGKQSNVPFHSLPDGAAVFVDPKTKNYKYVSNSEDENDGGVGSITFDRKGNVIGYDRLLSGTKRNCGGGKTFWNTWLSCEEVAGGEIWEVDPFTGKSRKTVMGTPYPALYESAAYDNRNPNYPTFYATIDRIDGPLLRYTPSAEAVAAATSSQDYSQLLHTAPSNAGAAYQYLVIDPNTKTFSWTWNVKEAEQSATQHYKNCEGLGTLFVTCAARWWTCQDLGFEHDLTVLLLP
jgi:Bacterial protein of unknown function (DUF839)